MAQINLHTDAHFEGDLARLMRLRGIPTKSAAIRTAVREALQRALEERTHTHFLGWLGAATGEGENESPRFTCDDDLWGDA
jgi:hypothetical protein